MTGTCESGNEVSGSIKCGEFLDWLRIGWLLKNESAPWNKLVSIPSPLSECYSSTPTVCVERGKLTLQHLFA